MARTSKRYIEKKSEKTERKVFKAGIYTRLSNERTEEWREKSYSSLELLFRVIKCTLDTLFVQIIHVFRAVHRFLANFVAVL